MRRQGSACVSRDRPRMQQGAGAAAGGCRKALKGQQGPNIAQYIDDLPGPSLLPLVLQLQLAVHITGCILQLWGRG